MPTNFPSRRMARTSIVIVACAVFISGVFRADVARAQGAKVGAVNPAKVFEDMQERKDLQEQNKNDLALLKAEGEKRAADLKARQDQRNLFKPESKQFQDADRELWDKSIEYETFVRGKTLQIEQTRKRQIVKLFDKITLAVEAEAKERGLDLVVADVRPTMPDPQQFEQITEGQLLQLLAQRNLFYNSPQVDLNAAVVARLDKEYKAGK